MQKSEAKNKRSNTDFQLYFQQFSYCPLIWMFHSRKLNNRINKIQEKSLRIVYKYKESDFLLARKNYFIVHKLNVQVQLLATEIYKLMNNLSPGFMNKIFTERTHPYNIKN